MLGAEFKFSKCFCISCVRMFHSTGITQGGHLGASFCTCLKVLKVTLGINWGCLLNWRHLSIVTIVLLLVGWKKDVENAWKCSYCRLISFRYFCTEVDMPSVAHHLVKAFDEANTRRKSNEAHHDSCDFYWSQLLPTAWLNDWLFCLLNCLGIFFSIAKCPERQLARLEMCKREMWFATLSAWLMTVMSCDDHDFRPGAGVDHAFQERFHPSNSG